MASTSSTWWRVGIAACAGIALAAGCSKELPAETPSPPPPIAPEVVVATSEATAADCPYGGTIVRSGLDANGNHVLDDSEVRTRTAVCNAPPAAPPPKVVIRIIAEPEEVCPEGGTGVQSGPDTNGNGALDDDEVSHTDVICGDPLATRYRLEPEGAHCIAGGIAFQVGHDRDRSHVLDDDEVEHTDFTCGDLLARSITIATAADVTALAGIRVIDGSLTIGGSALATASDVALPELQHVLGSLDVSSALALTRLSAPKLVDVQTDLSLTLAPRLTALELPALTRVGGTVRLAQVGLTDLSGLPALASVGQDLSIDGNPALTSVEMPFPAFRIAGDISVSENPALSALTMTVADGLSRLIVSNNSGLTSLKLAMIGVLPSGSALGDVFILGNPRLATATIDAAGVGSLSVAGNDSLTDVVVHAAGITGDAEFRQDSRLQHVTLGRPGHFGQFSIGGSLTMWSPVATLDTDDIGMSIAGLCSLIETNLTSLQAISRCGLLELGGNPRLTALSGVTFDNADIAGNPELASIQVTHEDLGVVEVRNNPKLESVVLSNAERLAGLTLEGNPVLHSVRAPLLTDIAGSLTFDRNAALEDIAADHLLHIGVQLIVLNSTALASLSLPSLVSVDQLGMFGNAALNHVALDALTQNVSATIDRNPRLPACEVDALFARLPGTHEQQGNDDTATCDPADPGDGVR